MWRGDLRCRPVAHDGAFDNQIAGAADHHQMLDIVPADQKQFSALVDNGHIHDRQSGLAAACLCRTGIPISSARKRRNNSKQDDDDDECNNELCYQCPRPEGAFKPTAHGRLLYPRRPQPSSRNLDVSRIILTIQTFRENRCGDHHTHTAGRLMAQT